MIIKIDSTLYGNNGSKIYSYTIQVLKSYKQEFHPISGLRTILSQDEAKCDFMFQIGKTYLIYAKTENNTLACSICSRTNLFENVAKNEIETLEKLYKKYNSDNSEIKAIRLENNILYQIGLVKNSFKEKLKSKDKTINILYGIVFSLVLLVLSLIIKIKNSR